MTSKESIDGDIHIRISHCKCWNTCNFQLLFKYLAMRKNTWGIWRSEWNFLGKKHTSHLMHGSRAENEPGLSQASARAHGPGHSAQQAVSGLKGKQWPKECAVPQLVLSIVYIQKHSHGPQPGAARFVEPVKHPWESQTWKLEQRKRHSGIVPVAWFSLLGLPYGIQEMLLQNMVGCWKG